MLLCYYNLSISLILQGLSEARVELRRQEQVIGQLNRLVSSLEGEKKALQEHVTDAENALRTAAK